MNQQERPKEFSKQNLDKNEITAAHKKFGRMMFVKWAGKLDIFFSTVHQLEYPEVKQRKKLVLVPSLVQSYNLFIDGVDKVDKCCLPTYLKERGKTCGIKKNFDT